MPEPAPQTPVLWEPLAWIRNDDQNFLISTAIAIAVIVIWGCHRFNVPSFAQKPSHPETMLLPVDLAPPREYLKGISIYVSMLVAGYIAMLVLGPAVLQSLGVPKNVAIESLQSPSSYPILLVLLITGMLPYTWKLSSVESWMRDLAHRAAGIPSDVRRLKEGLLNAELDMPVLLRCLHRRQANDPLSFLSADDITNSQNVFQKHEFYGWARACCLISALDSGSLRVTISENHKLEIQFQNYRSELKQIFEDMERYSNIASDSSRSGSRVALASRIEDFHGRVVLLCVLTVLRSTRTEDEARRKIAQMGFLLPRRLSPLKLAELTLVTLAVCGAVVVFAGITWELYLRSEFPGMFADKRVETVYWMINTLVQYFLAGTLTVWLRSWLISRGDWQEGVVKKTFVSAAVSILTILGIAVFDAIFKLMHGSETVNLNLLPLFPFAFPVFVISTVVLRIIRMSCSAQGRWSRLSEAALLGCTMLFVTATIVILQRGYAPNDIPDLIATIPGKLDSTEASFTILLAGVCGAAIGYVIPHEYRKAVFTSITPESRLRLQELRRQIQESRRPDQEDWFGIPNPELGGITPWEASRYNSLTWELDRLVRELGASPDKVWSTQFDWSSINTPIVNTSEEGQRRRVAKLAKAHSSPSSRLRLMRTRFMQKT